jgi:hypothetical protein
MSSGGAGAASGGGAPKTVYFLGKERPIKNAANLLASGNAYSTTATVGPPQEQHPSATVRYGKSPPRDNYKIPLSDKYEIPPENVLLSPINISAGAHTLKRKDIYVNSYMRIIKAYPSEGTNLSNFFKIPEKYNNLFPNGPYIKVDNTEKTHIPSYIEYQVINYMGLPYLLFNANDVLKGGRNNTHDRIMVHIDQFPTRYNLSGGARRKSRRSITRSKSKKSRRSNRSRQRR